MTFLDKLIGFILLISSLEGLQAFTHPSLAPKLNSITFVQPARHAMSLNASADDKAAKEVTGEELELMLTEWDTPLLVDAYATWWVFKNND